MSEIRAVLDDVLSAVKQVRLNEAQEQLIGLLKTMGAAEIRVWESEITEVIEAFLPKRQRKLMGIFDDVKQQKSSTSVDIASTIAAPNQDLELVIEDLRSKFVDLSERHIFRWSTNYRDEIGSFFTSAVSLAGDGQGINWKAVKEHFQNHSREIFTKGYFHVTRNVPHDVATHKSMGGLRRFLDLVIEFYTGAVGPGLPKNQAIALRGLGSACLSGIVSGYSEATFGPGSGIDVLRDQPEAWVYILGFLVAEDIQEMGKLFSEDDLKRSLYPAARPTAAALDKLLRTASDYLPLPVLSQYRSGDQRLEISLQPSQYTAQRQLVEIHCYLDSVKASISNIRDSIARGVSVIVAPLRPDVRQLVSQNPSYIAVVPTMEEGPEGVDTRDRIVSILEEVVYKERNPRVIGSQPLRYNFAREFPLSDPVMSPFYFVIRNSVRDLLRTFERRNGVRLWCSVRRSGKTKAGSDLASTTEESTLITQTCDSTGDALGDGHLYMEISRAIEDGRQISSRFVRDTLANCTESGRVDDQRIVLVIDEYETLFGRLRTAVRKDEGLRYTVVQPLLNQLVEFARENLLVLLGQQPNAHLILMDQNQLSPYVQQDPFPLFQNTDGSPEFQELVSKVFAGRATFDASFLRRLFVETAGHPYLTVNLLVDFVEWLIKSKRTLDSLNFTSEDLSTFASRGFRRDNISVSAQYQFFRDGAIPQALGPLGRERSPWLYCMYSLLQHISRESPETFTCSRNDFAGVVSQLGLDRLGFSPDNLLVSGSQSNFLSFNDRIVLPRIRLLGRIAAVSTAEVS